MAQTTPAQYGLDHLRAALAAARRPFVVYGDIPLTEPIKLVLSGNAPDIGFPPTSPDDFAPLFDACHQASFGRGSQDVVDPTYRRALVLYGKDFGIAPGSAVDPYALSIIRDLQAALFGEGIDHHRHIICKIDQLNFVYRQGDFFKSHVDTPRSANVFGTLLINLPVAHVGGQLIVRPPAGGERAIPETAGNLIRSFETKWGGTDTLGWVAFFSDCSHEVLPVVSGNRVTLTYKLFLEDERSGGRTEVNHAESVTSVVVQQLENALASPGLFTDNRPRLCFHLQHQYPVDLNDTVAETVRPMLKERDVILYRALIRAGLAVSFHFIVSARDDLRSDPYEPDKDPLRILPVRARIHLEAGSDDGVLQMSRWANGKRLGYLGIVEVEPVPEDENTRLDHEERLRFQWEGKKYVGGGPTKWPFGYVTYGNEASLVTCYASLCIVALEKGKEVTTVWPQPRDDHDGLYEMHPNEEEDNY